VTPILLKIVPPPARGYDLGAWLRIVGVGAGQLLEAAARKVVSQEEAGIEPSKVLQDAIDALADDVVAIRDAVRGYVEAGLSFEFGTAPSATRLVYERNALVGTAPVRSQSPELAFVVAALEASA